MYYLIFVLLMIVPIFLFVVGLRWYLKPPAFQSKGLAYRTAVTENNPDAWLFAHTHCGKLWARYGFIFGALSALCMIFLKKYYQDLWLWLIGLQMAMVCVTIFIIDYLCKNLYDKDDNKPADEIAEIEQ